MNKSSKMYFSKEIMENTDILTSKPFITNGKPNRFRINYY
jgi:hypothetical protein